MPLNNSLTMSLFCLAGGAEGAGGDGLCSSYSEAVSIFSRLEIKHMHWCQQIACLKHACLQTVLLCIWL